MYGFGSVPFGEDGFGDNGYSRYLFDSLISPIRQADAAEGDLLWGFTEAVRPIIDGFRIKIRDMGDLINPLRCRSADTQTTRLKLGAVYQPTDPPLQRGFNGVINNDRYFFDPTLRLTTSDVGRVLELDSPNSSTGRIQVTIFEVISARVARISKRLPVDAGPIAWVVRQPMGLPNNVTVEVRGGDVRQMTPGWRLFDGEKTFEVQARRLFGTRYDEGARLVDASGDDATIDSQGRLVVQEYTFTHQDVGKPVQFSDSVEDLNNNRFEIAEVVSAHVVVLTTPALETGVAFSWALLPWPLLRLQGTARPRGCIIQEGSDLQVTGPSTVKANSAVFTADHVGMHLTLRGSSLGNNLTSKIVGVTTAQIVVLEATTLSVEGAVILWEHREGTGLGDDLIEVDSHATSLLSLLASNYGIKLDKLETEARQRAFLQHVELWTSLTAHESGYRLLANLAGFDLELAALYHISFGQYRQMVSIIEANSPALSLSSLLELGDTGLLYDGSAATLSLGPRGQIRLTDPDFIFSSRDIGRVVRVRNSAESGNNQLYEITDFISEHVVEFHLRHSGTFPDTSAVDWRYVQFYTSLPPQRPLFDEINIEQIGETLGPGNLILDMFCWEPDYDTRVQVTVDSVVAGDTTDQWLISVEGVVTATDPEVVAKAGNWIIEDDNGVQYRLDTVPEDIGGGVYTFLVTSVEAPVFTSTFGYLEYLCPVVLTCEYCHSFKLQVILTPQGVLTDGSSTERLYARMFDKLEEYMLPSPMMMVRTTKTPVGLAMPFSAKVEV